jgi:hypothetical protein
MTFYCIKRIKGHPYLYRQTNRRVGGKVVSETVYVGPAEGAIPYGAAPKSIDPSDGKQRRRVEEKISRSLSVSAERLAREIARKGDQDRKARRIRRVRFQLGALQHLEGDERLWRKL